MNDLATNPQGEGAIAPEAATEVTAPSKIADSEPEVEAKPEGQPAEGDTDEVEHEGQKYRVPKALKGAFLMHADYTRKTQDVAEQRRALETHQTAIGQQAAMLQEHGQDISRLVALNDQIAAFDKVEWASLRQSHPEQSQDMWFHYMQLQDARNKMTGELQAKVNNRTHELQRHAAKRVDEARAILQRDIKDWSPELAGKLVEFGARELGFTPQEISGVSDPRLIKLLHRAFIGDQAVKKAAAAAKLAAQEGLKPPAQVGGSASSNARKPTEASGDRLSADEWMRQRNEQLRKKGWPMANTLLTPTQVTREALRILHQKLRFVGSINRQYDDSFAKKGAKIGDTLKIRLPNQYTVRTGATLSAQDTTESSVSLQIATQKGVDLNFTSADLTLSLDDFGKRVLNPAMAVLAAAIESDALNMRKDVNNQVNNTAAAITWAKVLAGRKLMQDNLAPEEPRYALLNTQDNADLVDALKGLFNDQARLGKQYREGVMGSSAGYDFMESTHLGKQSRGAGNSAYLSNGATQTGATIAVDTGTGTIKQGEIVTFAGVFSVHPETKISTGNLMQFALTADFAGGAGNITITPAIVATGATQNVSNAIADNSAMTIAGTASTDYGQSLLYQEDAFAFATADLVMPQGVDFSAREVFDGVSMRIVRQYDINNDKFPCRLDVLYGYKTLRGYTACRLANN